MRQHSTGRKYMHRILMKGLSVLMTGTILTLAATSLSACAAAKNEAEAGKSAQTAAQSAAAAGSDDAAADAGISSEDTQAASEASDDTVFTKNAVIWGIEQGIYAEQPADGRVTLSEFSRVMLAQKLDPGAGLKEREERGPFETASEKDLLLALYRSKAGLQSDLPSDEQLYYWGRAAGYDAAADLSSPLTRKRMTEILYIRSGGDAGGTILHVPYFNQALGFYTTGTWRHADWGSARFSLNSHTLAEGGCGFTAAAMALSYLSGRVISPLELMENGEYTGNGAAHTVALKSAQQFGISAHQTNNMQEAVDALSKGYPVVVLEQGPSLFSANGHYILLTGLKDDGSVVIANPGKCEQSYGCLGKEVSFTQEEIDERRADDGGYTIIGLP